MKRAYAKIYAFLYGQLSEESKAKVKTVQNWDDIEKSNDPLDLWKAIVATHMAAVTGATACDKSRARSAYSNINQDSTESVASLKKRIDNALKVYDAVGQSRPADEELAADFIRKLDANRFAGLRADLENKQLVSGQYGGELQGHRSHQRQQGWSSSCIDCNCGSFQHQGGQRHEGEER